MKDKRFENGDYVVLVEWEKIGALQKIGKRLGEVFYVERNLDLSKGLERGRIFDLLLKNEKGIKGLSKSSFHREATEQEKVEFQLKRMFKQ